MVAKWLLEDSEEEVLEDRMGHENHRKVAPKHSGRKGHYCFDWDGMWICEDCIEFETCFCFVSELACTHYDND